MIEEQGSNVPTEEKHLPKKVFLSTFGILLLLAVVVSGYYFRNELPIVKNLVKSNDLTTPESRDEQTELTGEQIQQKEVGDVEEISDQNELKEPVTKNNEKENVVTTKATPINCGKDMSCFINNTKNCSPSTVEFETSISVFDLYQTASLKLDLTGFNASKKCGYESRVLATVVGFTDEFKLTPEYKAEKLEDLEKVLTQANEAAKSVIGSTTKCAFTTDYLTNLMTKQMEGNYTSKDFVPGNCVMTDSTGKIMPTSY